MQHGMPNVKNEIKRGMSRKEVQLVRLLMQAVPTLVQFKTLEFDLPKKATAKEEI